MRFSKKIVIICIVSVIIFTLITLWGYYTFKQQPPETLTKLWFAFMGGELLTLCLKTTLSDAQDKNSVQNNKQDTIKKDIK